MGPATLWLRWSWRDLRARWLVVLAIAIVIALGTGTYAAFTGSATWRRVSNDKSFAALNTHDVRLRLSAGTTAPQGALLDVLAGIPSVDKVTAAEERLVQPIQVEVLGAGEDLLVTGEVLGTGRPASGQPIDDVYVSAGHPLTAADTGQPVVVLERNFADYHGLPASGRLRVSGDQAVRYAGHGQWPDNLIVTGEGGTGFFSHSTYAALYTSLATAQRISRSPGRVNDLVLTLRDSDDARSVKRELQEALREGQTAVSASVTTRAGMPSYRLLYRDIENDQKVWNVVAGLILAGAAFAAFNLTGRIVEAQRREIGVGMALGVPRSVLAVRPLLLGGQIALIGVVFGVLMGAAVGAALSDTFKTLLPLPVWDTSFQMSAFARAAALGFLLPMVAVCWPVWRAVRVEPVEAIRVGHLAGRGRGGGPAPWLGRVSLARSSIRRMPLRNVLRTPRRTMLTALGIGAAVTALVAIFGMLDSFASAIDQEKREVAHDAPRRVSVQLLGLQPAGSPQVSRVTAATGVADASTGLSLPATVRAVDRSAGAAHVDVVLQTLSPDSVWTPTVSDGAAPRGQDEILLSRKAAADLGVAPGDQVVVSHPQRVGADQFRTVQSRMRVAGTHPDPVRVPAYADASVASRFGFAGLVNVVQTVPEAGVPPEDVQRAMLASPVVASAQSVTATTDALETALEQFTSILIVAAGVVLLLALLIAFNAASIAVDERARENATMLAYGLPVRSLLAMQTTESALTGLLGTALGLAAGFGVLSWMVGSLLAETAPDFGLSPVLSATTVATAFALGVLAVAVAPLFTVRRLRRMDVPSALRVIE